MLTICASCNVITFLLLLIGIDTDLANRIYVCSRASLQIVSPPGSSCIVLLPRAVNRVVCQPCIHFQAPRAFLNSISDLQVPPVTCREKLYPTSMSQTTRGLQIPSAQPARMMCFDMFVPPFQRSWETRSLRKHRRRVEDEYVRDAREKQPCLTFGCLDWSHIRVVINILMFSQRMHC